jgi:hypothetical protein
VISKQTDPMAKFIRTGEGVLVFGFNVALLVVPIVSSSLTAAQSAKWATIIDSIAVISRTGLKMVASARPKPTAAAAALGVASPPAYSLIGAAAAAGAPAATAPRMAGTPGPALPQVAAALAPDVSAIGQLVADAEEFADPPSAAESEPTPPLHSMSSMGNGQVQVPSSEPPQMPAPQS